MSTEMSFDKNQIDSYLKEVAKQYRKMNKKGMRAEITLIGGASILINYKYAKISNPFISVNNSAVFLLSTGCFKCTG